MIEDNGDDGIKKALQNLNGEREPEGVESTTTQSQDSLVKNARERANRGPEPEEGNVGNGGTIENKYPYWERKCREYAKKFIGGETEYPSIDVDLTKVTWEVSGRMTRTLGRCFYSNPRPGEQRIKMSKPLIDEADWSRVQCTIRHELVHVWQKQNNEPTGHGHSFKQWCDTLDIDVRADNPASQDYKYEIYCPNCGLMGGKMKNCKSVRQIVNEGKRHCRTCGPEETRGELWVEKDGRKLERI